MPLKLDPTIYPTMRYTSFILRGLDYNEWYNVIQWCGKLYVLINGCSKVYSKSKLSSQQYELIRVWYTQLRISLVHQHLMCLSFLYAIVIMMFITMQVSRAMQISNKSWKYLIMVRILMGLSTLHTTTADSLIFYLAISVTLTLMGSRYVITLALHPILNWLEACFNPFSQISWFLNCFNRAGVVM